MKYNRDRYIPPLQRLLRRNQSWKPKKVIIEESLQRAYKRGELSLFEQPEELCCYHIHKKTDLVLLDKLIHEANTVNHFTMDTENDSLTHRPATLQIEFIKPGSPSTVIIIEVQHLPEQTSIRFKKIQQLCTIIFTLRNHIYSWGPVNRELDKFDAFSLFSSNLQIIEHEIQGAFKTWYGNDDDHDPNNPYSLQFAMKAGFNQYLDKTATLSEWACGIDLVLNTYLAESAPDNERTYRINEEKKYRSILKNYAINDVLAVTKLSYLIQEINVITPPTTIECEEPSNDEEQIDEQWCIELHPLDDEISLVHVRNEPVIHDQLNQVQQDPLEMNDLYEPWMVHDNPEEIEGAQSNGIDHYNDQLDEITDQRTVHILNEPMEVINNDEEDFRSLPDTLKPYFDRQPRHHHQQHRSTMVHVRNEPKQVMNLFHLGQKKSTASDEIPQKLKNRIANHRRRAKRYRYEVVRQIYPSFNITRVKRILKSMNIFYVNINIVRRTLYIGVKNQDVVNEVENQLNDRIFTEQHYHRLYPKKE